MTDFDNTGILSRNDRKQVDTHADFKGKAVIDGRAYWIDSWVKEKDGRKFFTLRFKPQDEPPRGKMTITSGRSEDVPF
jgi:hypothetical protein